MKSSERILIKEIGNLRQAIQIYVALISGIKQTIQNRTIAAGRMDAGDRRDFKAIARSNSSVIKLERPLSLR